MGLATERDIGRVRNADANTLGAPTSTEEKDPEVITVAKERQTITEKDALYLGFLGKFPGADAEAHALQKRRQEDNTADNYQHGKGYGQQHAVAYYRRDFFFFACTQKVGNQRHRRQ